MSQWARHTTGRDEIARFHRWMLKFAPDSVIEFSDACAADGRLYLEWVWSGTFEGALRLPDGSSVQSTDANFSVPGVAACRYAANGELLSHRDYWDLSTVLRQVGDAVTSVEDAKVPACRTPWIGEHLTN